jgi:hypothetical protein
MKVRSIPAGVAALVAALAVGFVLEMRETSGTQPASVDGQLRPRVAVARASARGDRLDVPHVTRGDRLDAAQRALKRRVFTARFTNAFAGTGMHVADEAADDAATNDAALAYASPQAPARAAVEHAAAMGVAAAPTRSLVPPEKRTRLASLEPAPPAPTAPSTTSPAIPDLDTHTAIYDIKAHTVYLPGGEKIEAHSGLGNHIDDPHSVSLRNRGATPPNTYRLELREHLFHGVRALRLIPVGDSNMYGRDGILAHTYMLGPSGQSNGCVSMRNYSAFLQAFLSGKVERLVVVPHLDKSNSRVASLR